MTEIGETIKKIRRGKGILQKDLYKGIVSKTFATQFEKGVHRINADAFLEILDRLLMTSKEFQRIHNDFQINDYTELSYAISDAINQKDINRLEALQKKLDSYQHIVQNSLLKALTNMNIARIKGKDLAEDDPNVKVILRFLSKIDSWTMSDVAFLTNFIPFIPYEMLIFQVKIIEERLKSQNEVRLLCYFYNNLLDRIFLEEDYKNAKQISARLKEVATDPEFLFFYLIAQVYSDLIDMNDKYDEGCMERINAIIIFLNQHTSFDLNEDLGRAIQKLKEKNKDFSAF